MKIHFSLPKDEGFFQDYALLIPTLYRLGFLAQVVSALTEFGIIYALVYQSLSDFIPRYAQPAALAGAIVGVCFLEVGLRKFIPYSCRAVLYRRFAGLHFVMSLFIFITTAGLLASSGLLSFKGSKDLVEAVAPQAKQESAAPVDSLYHSETAAVTGRVDALAQAVRDKYRGLVAVELAAIAKYEDREKRTGVSYARTKERLRAKVAALEAKAAGEIADLEATKADALALADERRQSRRAKIEASNDAALLKVERRTGRYGNGLAYFTVICLGVLLLSIALKEVHDKGAGVEEKALPNQYHFSQSVAGEFMEMLSDKFNYYSRALIRRLADATPEPPEPQEPPELYEYSPQMKRRQIGFKTQGNTQGSQSDDASDASDAQGQNEASVNNATVITQGGMKPKNCVQCGGEYIPKVSWQKYCSPECKEAYHSSHHGGQKFDPQAYRKRNRKP